MSCRQTSHSILAEGEPEQGHKRRSHTPTRAASCYTVQNELLAISIATQYSTAHIAIGVDDKGNTSHYYDDTINASSVCVCMHERRYTSEYTSEYTVSIQVSILVSTQVKLSVN